MKGPNNKARTSRARRWLGHLFREWTIESWRPIAPALARPSRWKWSDTQVTLAWLGHSTVLINFFGVQQFLPTLLLFARVGIRLPGITIGPKRLTAPRSGFMNLPQNIQKKKKKKKKKIKIKISI